MTPTRTDHAGTAPAVPVPDIDRPVRRAKTARTDLGKELDEGFRQADLANERRPGAYDGAFKGGPSGTGRSAAPGSSRRHTEKGFPATLAASGSIIQITSTRQEEGVRILVADGGLEYVAIPPDYQTVSLLSAVTASWPNLPLAQALLRYVP